MPNADEDVGSRSPHVLLAGVETRSAILDSTLVVHGQIKHMLPDLSIQFLGVQLKRSTGDTSKDVQGSTDNHNGGVYLWGSGQTGCGILCNNK